MTPHLKNPPTMAPPRLADRRPPLPVRHTGEGGRRERERGVSGCNQVGDHRPEALARGAFFPVAFAASFLAESGDACGSGSGGTPSSFPVTPPPSAPSAFTKTSTIA